VKWTVFSLLTSLALLLLIGRLAQEPAWMAAELWLSSLLHPLRNPTLTLLMQYLSWLGSTQALTLLTVFLVVAPGPLRGWSQRITFLTTALGASVLNLHLKNWFARTRPGLEFMPLVEEPLFSFPSGHAMLSTAIYGFLSYLLCLNYENWGYRPVLVACLLIGGIGVTRVYLAVHYPGDVLGGFAAGWLCLAVAMAVHRRLLGHVNPGEDG
jgi:undecaprenyl-diphosphatase